jgi:phosphotransferase system  glucose/maltose/N-acetylglucosamine-specific IIC component
VKREPIRQVILGLVGLVFVGLVYPLGSDLWHAKWLVQMNDNECEPMFLSFFIVLGVFLLLAVRKPSAHRSLIAFAGWWSLFHATVMAVQTIEAWNRGIHRDYTDVIIAGIIGAVLLAINPTEREAAAHRESALVVTP